jgi:uncharacterized protein YjbI with pentapeptide repeats
MPAGRRQVLTPLEKRTKMVRACLASRRLAHIDLSDTVFEGATCDNAVFVDVDLRRADFRGASLTNALFLRCDLVGAKFPDKTPEALTRARFIACSGLEAETARTLRRRGVQGLDDLVREAKPRGPSR